MKRYLIWIDPYPVHPDIFIRQPCLGTSLSRGNPASRAININPGSTLYTRSDSCSHRKKKKKKKELNSLGLDICKRVIADRQPAVFALRFPA
jgi:hypothetical protein